VIVYRRGLDHPRSILLDEQETWMRPFVTLSNKSRAGFWKEVETYPTVAAIPKSAERRLRQSLPAGSSIQRFATRRKGGGSLGRARYVAIASWRGGHLVREAKALVPSAWDWAHGAADVPSRFMKLAGGEHRSPDPFLSAGNGFIVRRIAADSRKVEFGTDSRLELRARLLIAMGFDLGAIHAADPRADQVRNDLKRRPVDWLHKAGKIAATWVEDDFRAWRRSR
jgi:hypothetical protein